MQKLHLLLPILTLTNLLSVAVPGQTQGTQADYERANNLARLVQHKVFKARVEAHWLPGNTRFWYRNDLPNNAREFMLVDAIKGTHQPAFDQARLAGHWPKRPGNLSFLTICPSIK